MSCSICLETYTHPITISCQHTFCYHCIVRWIDQASSAKPSCPVCRTHIRKQLDITSRLTRSMTEHQRKKKFINTLTQKLYQWQGLSNSQNTKKVFKKKLDLLHEFFQLIYKNIWLINRNQFCFFRHVLKEKIAELEKEGYKEVKIWKYKLRTSLSLDLPSFNHII